METSRNERIVRYEKEKALDLLLAYMQVLSTEIANAGTHPTLAQTDGVLIIQALDIVKRIRSDIRTLADEEFIHVIRVMVKREEDKKDA
jgi:hypothetical protein